MNFLKTNVLVENKILLVFFVACLFLSSCGKKQKNETLAHSYFKMAFSELSGEPTVQGYKKALVHMDKALGYDKKPEYYALKGTVLFNLQDYDAGQQAFEQALAANPSPQLRSEVLNNVACLWAQKGEVKRACDTWLALIDDTSYQTPEVAYVNMGKLYTNQGDFISAYSCFDKAVSIAPSFVDAHFYAAYAAHKQGDLVAAKKELDIVLSLEPEHVGAGALAAQLH